MENNVNVLQVLDELVSCVEGTRLVIIIFVRAISLSLKTYLNVSK